MSSIEFVLEIFYFVRIVCLLESSLYFFSPNSFLSPKVEFILFIFATFKLFRLEGKSYDTDTNSLLCFLK